MERTRAVLLVALVTACGAPAQAAPRVDSPRLRLEVGVLDDRYMMFLTQTAPLVQQFTGSTVAAVWTLASTDLWPGGRLGWTAGLESGLSFDSTGLCRWFVRAAEQSTLNSRTGGDQRPPALTAALLFGMPVSVPLRVRTGAELTVVPAWRVELGVEAGALPLVYGAGCAAFRADIGVSLGTLFWISRSWGIGLRLRALSFGDAADRWPGLGATLYVAYTPGWRRGSS